MLGTLGLLISAMTLLGGTLLLASPASGPEVTQTVRLLAGAVFVSLGSLTLLYTVKNWWRWRRNYKAALSAEIESAESRVQSA